MRFFSRPEYSTVNEIRGMVNDDGNGFGIFSFLCYVFLRFLLLLFFSHLFIYFSIFHPVTCVAFFLGLHSFVGMCICCAHTYPNVKAVTSLCFTSQHVPIEQENHFSSRAITSAISSSWLNVVISVVSIFTFFSSYIYSFFIQLVVFRFLFLLHRIIIFILFSVPIISIFSSVILFTFIYFPIFSVFTFILRSTCFDKHRSLSIFFLM